MRALLLLLLPACGSLPSEAPAVETPAAKTPDPPESEVDLSAFLTGEIDLPEGTWPTGIVRLDDRLLVGDARTGSILEIDPSSRAVIGTRPASGTFPTGLATSGGLLFTTDLHQARIVRRRAEGPAGPGPLPYYGTSPWGLAAEEGRIYVLDVSDRTIRVVEDADGAEIRTFPAPGRRPTALAWGEGRLWAADAYAREIYAMDPASGQVVHGLPSPARFPSGLAVHGDRLFVSDLQAGRLFEVRPFAERPVVEDRWQRYEVELRVDLVARGPGEVTDPRAAFAVPETRPGQRIGQIRYSPEPDEVVQWPSGQRIATFRGPPMKDGDRRALRMTVDVEVGHIAFQVDPDRVQAVPSILPADVSEGLQDGRKVRLTDDSVQRRVREVLGDETRPYHRVRRIYESVVDEIAYDLSGGWGAAPVVLERGTGSCSEYTFALVALLRAAGIPARYVGAIVNRTLTGGVDHVFHRWAEAWLGEPWGWVPLDANRGKSEDPAERARGFGTVPNRYLVTTVSYGETDLLDWDYNYRVEYDVSGDATLEATAIAVWTPRPR
ncbi:MAG: hypothetical protein JXB39_07585 [Deltaproteobacteria bacterium]|nr:hypothetical protein [Deltaproteobacteria bacterium]